MITFYIQILFTLLIYLALEKDILVLKNQLQFKHFPTKFQRRKELIFSFFFLRLQPNWKKKWWMLALWWSVINHWVTFQTFSGISNKYFWSIQGVQYTYVDWEYCLVKARFFENGMLVTNGSYFPPTFKFLNYIFFPSFWSSKCF